MLQTVADYAYLNVMKCNDFQIWLFSYINKVAAEGIGQNISSTGNSEGQVILWSVKFRKRFVSGLQY